MSLLFSVLSVGFLVFSIAWCVAAFRGLVRIR